MATSSSGTTLKAKVVKSQLKLRTLTDSNFGTLSAADDNKVVFYDAATDSWKLKDLITDVDYTVLTSTGSIVFDGGTF